MNAALDVRSFAVSSRVRLARNLYDYPFNTTAENLYSNGRLVDEVYRVVSGFEKLKLLRMSEMSQAQALYLKDRYLISSALIANTATGAVILNSDETVSIMLNEEDHIREQCFVRGCDLKAAYNKIRRIDKKLCERLPMAKDTDLGYLTACLTNLGTGLRASVMLFLPALTVRGKMAVMADMMRESGMTVRGVFGEGSKPEGCLYQVSNETTFGYSEEEILKKADFATQKLIELEYNERGDLYDELGIKLEDECKRAYGILCNCALLATDEFMRLMSSVKLGASLGILPLNDYETMDNLIVNMRPDAINYGGEMLASERDRVRAQAVGAAFAKMK